MSETVVSTSRDGLHVVAIDTSTQRVRKQEKKAICSFDAVSLAAIHFMCVEQPTVGASSPRSGFLPLLARQSVSTKTIALRRDRRHGHSVLLLLSESHCSNAVNHVIISPG
jgi:hypothetical protein